MLRSGVVVAVALSALFACTGRITDGEVNGGLGAGRPGAGNGTAEAPTCDARPQPIKRLSHAEYRNTLRDLLPTVELPALELVSDETLEGFTNNFAALNPSLLLVEQYWNATRAIVEALGPTIDQYVSCDMSTGVACAEAFIREFGRRAFRRPLTVDEVADFRALFEQPPGDADFRVGVQLTIQAMLSSPSFLYRPELGEERSKDVVLSGYETASRLSYFLWGSMPDETLLQAAESGELSDGAALEAQVRRMLADDHARETILQFHREWLKLAAVDRVLKRPEDNYDAAFRADLKESMDRFVWDTIQGSGSPKELLTSTRFPVSSRTAALFGVAPPEPGTWLTAEAPAGERAGVLTHPAFLASHAYAGYGSPVLRGVYVLDRILCTPPKPPPPGVATEPPDRGSESAPLTNREAYASATSGGNCQACHESINNIGFAFEHYDTMGRYRTTDNGQPVDASGEVLDLKYGNAVQLAQGIAESDRFNACVTDKWTTFAVGGGPLSNDPCFLDEVEKTFTDKQFDVKELIVAIATHPKFARAAVVPMEPSKP
jgi:hypothetical protein